jgi:hypothetical protein
MTNQDDPLSFLKDHRWELAKAHLDRADQSANLIRGLLFAAAGAAIGFILHQDRNALGWHVLPLILFAIAAGVDFLELGPPKKPAIGADAPA